jgi:hypothetical protein
MVSSLSRFSRRVTPLSCSKPTVTPSTDGALTSPTTSCPRSSTPRTLSLDGNENASQACGLPSPCGASLRAISWEVVKSALSATEPRTYPTGRIPDTAAAVLRPGLSPWRAKLLWRSSTSAVFRSSPILTTSLRAKSQFATDSRRSGSKTAGSFTPSRFAIAARVALDRGGPPPNKPLQRTGLRPAAERQYRWAATSQRAGGDVV